MRVKVINSDSSNSEDWWKYFNRIKKRSIYHSPDYIKILEKYLYKGSKAELFIYGDDENFVYYPYLKRSLDKLPFADKVKGVNLSQYSDIVSSWYYGGPLWEVRQAPESTPGNLLKEFVEKFGIYCSDNNIVSEFIRFDPSLKNYKISEVMPDVKLDRLSVNVDLTQSEEQIWSNFEGSNRTRIRKAKKSGIVVERSNNPSDIEVFVDIYKKEMKRKKAGKHFWFEMDFFMDLYKQLEDRFQLFMCKYKDANVGGAIVVRDCGIAHSYLMATDFDYWKYHPNNYSFFEQILWCKRNGDKIFDLQPGRPGVFNYKKAFSPGRGEFQIASIVHNDELYNKLTGMVDREKAEINKNFFPLYRV